MLLISRYCQSDDTLYGRWPKCTAYSHNSNTPETNFTKLGYEGGLDTVVILVVLVFQEFLLISAQMTAESELLLQKMDVLSCSPAKFCGTNFHGGTYHH